MVSGDRTGLVEWRQDRCGGVGTGQAWQSGDRTGVVECGGNQGLGVRTLAFVL